MRMQSNTPQNRDETGRFLTGQSGNPGGRPVGFHNYIQERTDYGGQQDSRSRESCNHDEHLRTRTQGRLRAGTSGYGEVRVGTCVSVLE